MWKTRGYWGSVQWPQDPFFRPTVGMYLGEKLIAVTPTFRVPPAKSEHSNSWPCWFSFPTYAVARLQRRPYSIVCLETGEEVRSSMPSWEADDNFSVDRLMRYARHHDPKPNVTGFTTFLSLEPPDQISLLYWSVLGRGPDEGGVRSKLRLMESRKWSILDLRDELLGSEEFWRRPRSIDETVGTAIVRGELKLIADKIIFAAFEKSGGHHARNILPARDAEERLPGYIASVALGPTATVRRRARWLRDHAADVRALRPQRAVESVLTRPKPDTIVYSGLLSSLVIGEAGRRTAGGIKSIRGHAGIICSGNLPHTRSGVVSLNVYIRQDGDVYINDQANVAIEIRTQNDDFICSRVLKIDEIRKSGLATLTWKSVLASNGVSDGQLILKIVSKSEAEFEITRLELALSLG